MNRGSDHGILMLVVVVFVGWVSRPACPASLSLFIFLVQVFASSSSFFLSISETFISYFEHTRMVSKLCRSAGAPSTIVQLVNFLFSILYFYFCCLLLSFPPYYFSLFVLCTAGWAQQVQPVCSSFCFVFLK